MPNYLPPNQRGFTLIEMSIVLVIIGLIVGGILKGQEVIESARQKNMAALYDQLRSAHTTFVDRYKALPGDYRETTTKINATVGAGDGNGVIGTLATGTTTLASQPGNVGENVNYFNSLIAAGLFGGGQVLDTTGGATAADFSGRGGSVTSPLPPAPWSSTGLMVAHGNHQGSGTGNSKSAPWLRLQTYSATLTATEASLTGASAFQLDTKIDDGLPFRGRLRTSGYTASPCGDGSTTTYTVTAATDSRQCDMLFAVE